MRLQSRISFYILGIFLLSLIIIGVILFSNSKNNLESQIRNQLISNSENIESHINTFLTQQQRKIELIATQSSLTQEELNEMIKLDNSFYDFFVINSSGQVIISTNNERVGLDRKNRAYFYNARNQSYVSPVYFALVPKAYSLAVSTPFHDGVLVGAMKINILDNLLNNDIGMGETGENLLGFIDSNESLVYFSKRRLSNISFEVVSKELAKDRPIYDACIGIEKLSSDSFDYRNKKVLSFTNYIEKINIGLVSKIDYDEAFKSVNNLRNETILLVILTLIVISFIIYLISRSITSELKSLTENINNITKGDLNIQLKKSKITEIQKLTDSLNRILASMKLAILRTGISKEELGVGELEKTNQELENRYKILYESSNDAIMILDPESGKFLEGNPSCLEMFGCKTEEEFISLGPSDLSPKYQPDKQLSSVKAKKMMEKAMKQGQAFFDWTHKKYKGKEFKANVLLSKIKLNDKEVLLATVRSLEK